VPFIPVIRAILKAPTLPLKNLYPPLLLFIFLSHVCCRQESLDFDELGNYISDPENGLLQSRETGPYSVTARFIPPSYLALQELVREKRLSDSAFRKLEAAYSKTRTFQLVIEAEPPGNIMHHRLVADLAGGDTSLASIQSRTRYLQHELTDEIVLVEGGQRQAPLLYTMESSPQDAHKLSFILVFPASQGPAPLTDFKLLVGKDLLQYDSASLSFKEEDVNRLPNIKI